MKALARTPNRSLSVVAAVMAIVAVAGAGVTRAAAQQPAPIKDLGGVKAPGGAGVGLKPKGSLLGRDKTLLPPPPVVTKPPNPVPPRVVPRYSRGPVQDRGVIIDSGGGLRGSIGGTVAAGPDGGSFRSAVDAQVGGNPTLRLHAGVPVADYGGYRRRLWPMWPSGGRWSSVGWGRGPRWCDSNGMDYGAWMPLYAPTYVSLEASPGQVPSGAAATAQPEQPSAEPTAFDRCMLALQGGQPEMAVGLLKEHLAQDVEDTGAMRLLGFSLLYAKKPAEAAAMMAMAYEKDPSLAAYPLDVRSAVDPEQLRKLLLNAVT